MLADEIERYIQQQSGPDAAASTAPASETGVYTASAADRVLPSPPAPRLRKRHHAGIFRQPHGETGPAGVDTYYDQSHRFRMPTLRLRPKPVDSNKDHRDTLKAIVRGDADTARHIHRKHPEKSGRLMVDLLQSHGLNQL